MAGRAEHEGQPGFSGGVGRGWKRHDRWAPYARLVIVT